MSRGVIILAASPDSLLGPQCARRRPPRLFAGAISHLRGDSDIDITDPRMWPAADAADPFSARLHRLASDAIAAATRDDADALDAAAKALLREALDDAQSARLDAALASAPSLDVSRHLW